MCLEKSIREKNMFCFEVEKKGLPIEELSQKTGKCKSSVKKALKELDDAGLLIRKFGGFSKPILERCIPIKIDGVSRREAMANDDMQTMKNILKI